MTDSAGGGKGMAIAAMVLGIAAFFPGCCLAEFYVNYILAVIAIILGVKAMGGPGGGMAKTGLILGVVSIVLYVVLTIVGVQAGDSLQKWAEEQQAAQQNDGDGGGDAGSGDDSSGE